jgi:RsiW-degrading membrane proteinase PrsW (M82 family)
MNFLLTDKEIFTLILTSFPAIILISSYFIYFKKRGIDQLTFSKVFLGGILINFPAGYLNDAIISIFKNGDLINDSLLKGYFAGGLVEELLKFSILYFFVFKTNSYKNQFEAIFYGITVSIGFALLENFHYVYSNSVILKNYSDQIAMVRSYSALVLHSLNGIVMGFYFSFFAINKDKKFLGFCILLPVIFHGTYNFLISIYQDYGYCVIVIMILFIFQLYRKFKNIINH